MHSTAEAAPIFHGQPAGSCSPPMPASASGLGDSAGFATALGTGMNPMQMGGFGMQQGGSSCGGEDGWFESSLSAAPRGP